MYKVFDLTGMMQEYKDVTDLVADIRPDEPSKITSDCRLRGMKIESCSPDEDERLMIVLLPRMCTKHTLYGCYEVHSLTMWHPSKEAMCVMFVLKMEKDGAFAAFNQADSVFKTELHCFTWDGKEQIFSSDDELSLKMLGYVDTSD